MESTSKKNQNDVLWREIVARYEHPSLPRSLGQIANTMLPYFALLCAMYLCLNISYWITLVLALPAAAFVVRTFIILHDCGHGSFFKSKRANRLLGFVAGILTFIPSYYWSHDHAKHHATAGDLDHRGSGDIWTLTVREYLGLSPWRQALYRSYRNPLVMFILGPIYLFLIRYRVWLPQDGQRVRYSAIKTNAALLGIGLVMHLTIGIKAYVMIMFPIMMLATMAGVWLFYVQHQFERTYWERHDTWCYTTEALEGSSFYKLPKPLQWLSGNIGFHHVHHLSPRIPNYHLQKCHESHPLFQRVQPLTLWSSLKSLQYRLWDEERKRLVGFDQLDLYRLL